MQVTPSSDNKRGIWSVCGFLELHKPTQVAASPADGPDHNNPKSRYVTMAAPSGCLRGRKNCDAINGCPQTGASIDSLLLVTDRISCFSHVIIVSTTF